MSEMRDHLQVAREAYQASRYPGDLASQVMRVRQNWWPRVIGTLVAGAAAAIVIMILLNRAIAPTAPRQVERVPIAAENRATDLTLGALPQMPAMPASLTALPTLDGPLLLPSLPGFPSLSLEIVQELPTTRESL